MLGKELRDYRKEHGYLQKEIAETLGISASLLSRIERGKREVTVEEERKILELFPELAKEKLPGKYTVYTDGGCGFNPGGPGGIGAVILDVEGKVIQEISKGFHASTNNRMELLAAIEALKTIPAGAEVKVKSDSQYLVQTMEEGWSRNKNHDLWKQLDEALRGKKVSFKWVRGHNGNQWNERCDELATAGINSGDKDVDAGYIPTRNASQAKRKPSTPPGGAMAVSLDVPELMPVHREDILVHEKCRKAIRRFQKSRRTFGDYLDVKTGGRDGWSLLGIKQLTEIIGSMAYSIAAEYLHEEKAVASCLRWFGRGMPLKDSIRKALVDMEVSSNCLKK